MKAYINAIGAITPQHTFDGSFFEQGFDEYSQPQLHCIEPDYKEFINPTKLRRMPRILKMGLGAATICTSQSTQPDAIIVGTGLGCLADLEKFQASVKNDGEQLLSPTPFVNSSHNMISSQIAIALGCHGYNMTHFHASLSFENALLDAMMLLETGDAENVLVGGIDEITEQHFQIAGNNGHWRKNNFSNSHLFEGQYPGTLMGEGAIFFMLGAKPASANSIKITGTHTLTCNKIDSGEALSRCLRMLNLALADIDTLILGRNGDSENDHLYNSLVNKPQTNTIYYKHLCGEYPTAPAFALWLGANILQRQTVPAFTIKHSNNNVINRIAICNSNTTEHGAMVIERMK